MTIFKLKTVTTEKAPLIVCSDQEGVIFSRNEMNATYANAARTALLQTRWQLRHNGLLGTFDERLIGMLRRSRRLYRENMTRLDYSSLGSLPTLEETPAILSAREYLQKLQ
jgi:hypothetical protein